MLIGLGIVALVYFVSLKHRTPSSFVVVFDTYREKPRKDLVFTSSLSKQIRLNQNRRATTTKSEMH